MRRVGAGRLARAGAAAAALSLGLVGAGGPATAGADAAGGGAGAGPGSGWSAGDWPTTAGTTLKTVRSIIRADTGTAAALTGQGVGIALIDTGIAPVPGLPAGQLVNGPDLSIESQSAQLRYLDTYGHGTHMAGIIVGNEPATGTVGLAPKAKVTSVKVGTSNGANDVTQIIAAIDWVVQHRNHDPANPIKVLNLSYGSGGMSPSTVDPLMFAVEQAWKAGIVVVVAAGNNGGATTTLTNPAMDPFVVAVGGSTTNNTITSADDDVAPFTNNSDQSRKPDLLAPGTSIVSLRTVGSKIDEQYPGARVGATAFKGSGTSQAAAVVSSAAALLLQQRPTLKPDQVKKLLVGGATALSTGTAGQKGMRELNVTGTLAMATPSFTQTFATATGTGSIETVRGGTHLTVNGTPLSGEMGLFGPFSASAWAARAKAQTAWSGGTWMGHRMAGDTWTGPSGAGGVGQISGFAGKCVDLQWGNTVNGTPIQLWDCNSMWSQSFTLAADGTVRVGGKCLDLAENNTGNNAKVHLWDCWGVNTQQWRVNSARQLVNVAASRCLDVPNLNGANGVQLIVWDCVAQDNQRWVPPYVSRTWSAATWSAGPSWTSGSWVDPEWTDRYWTGHYWSGHYWSGHYWSADDWSTADWS